MPIQIKYDDDKKILYVIMQGTLDPQEFEQVLTTIVSSREYPPDVATLWDVSAVLAPASLHSREDEGQLLRGLIDIRKKYPERGRAMFAVVAPSDLAFGMSRMYEALSSPMQQTVMVFRTVSEAERWLRGQG